MLELVVDSFIQVVRNIELQVKPAAQVHYDPSGAQPSQARLGQGHHPLQEEGGLPRGSERARACWCPAKCTRAHTWDK